MVGQKPAQITQLDKILLYIIGTLLMIMGTSMNSKIEANSAKVETVVHQVIKICERQKQYWPDHGDDCR